MKRILISMTLIGLAGAPLLAGGSVSGTYVEARTAEVFTGACIMSSEAETMGREAVLAWKIDRGSFNGVSLEGLSVVAALAGSANLGLQEIGGAVPTVRSTVLVDERANPVQRIALVAMANELSKGLLGTIVSVTPSPIRFSEDGAQITVAAAQLALEVAKHVEHEETCGSMLWFHPLADVDTSELGLTAQHSFVGSGLGVKWSDPNRRSSFFGTFSK